MPKPNDLSRSPVALNENTTLIAVIEMGLASWLIAGRVPGVNRSPLRKLDPEPEMLLARLHRWRDEAIQAGRTMTRIAVAYEAGRDGFWLARWLRTHGVESYVIHPTSIPVKRDHRRAKTDRLDTALLMRTFLGWLRGEADHCSMAAIPTLEDEDRKRPNREHQKLSGEKTRIISRVKGTLVRMGIRNFKGTCVTPQPVSNRCARPRASPSRRTQWPSWNAILRGSALSGSNLARSRRRASSAYRNLRWNSRMPWC